ncbi:inositol monophosphatase family protein [Marinomonas flavescens]|uniref:inositol monophosphatase family protein n=1 Tax=Marinomonas flavescens TaxID=2529379 RepID=UPI001054D506|nr:inositol monophosphatase family protein [Marinomonas flavescens]
MLYDPVLDDWIEASLGRGCWYGKPNQTSRQIPLSDKEKEPRLVGVMSPFLFQKTYQEPVVLLQVSYARTNSLRCCCHEYRSLVQGSYDFFVSPKPKVWDHAAGILAYQEAGGFVKMLTGEDYQASVRTGTIIAARTESILARITNDFKAILI